nr:hypothetical protein [Tanacetum cinerariifolium]
PMQEKLKLSKSQGASTPAEMKHMQNVPYSLAVGSIMYAVRCTRPDVEFAQNITSRFQQNLGDIYWTTVKNILKYLRNTKDMFLVYGGDQKRELRTGYVFVLNGGDVDWKSAKQSNFAISSTEAELSHPWTSEYKQVLGTDTQGTDKNKAKNDKTKRKVEKIEKDNINRSRKSKVKARGQQKSTLKNQSQPRESQINPDKTEAEK